jgi:DNA repair protein RadD
MDFAENIERHELEDDLFAPKISTSLKSGESFNIDATCPTCNTVNEFTGRSDPDYKDFGVDKYGYYIDLAGNLVETDKGVPMPAHYGRRCMANTIKDGEVVQCVYRWSMKVCDECEQENDIAARYCSNKKCKNELIDPNEKLAMEFKRIKQDPDSLTSDKVIGWNCKGWHSQRGTYMLKVDYTTEFRTFSAWYAAQTGKTFQERQWASLSQAVFGEGHIAPDVDMFLAALKKGHGKMPVTVTVKRTKSSKFYSIYAHNDEETVQD